MNHASKLLLDAKVNLDGDTAGISNVNTSISLIKLCSMRLTASQEMIVLKFI